MCENLTMLAKESATRFIAQCECGTVHLVWDNLSLRLRPPAFIGLAEYVCAKAGDLLNRDDQKGIGFRINGIGVRFPHEALATLRDLMHLAMLQLDEPSEEADELETMEIAPDGFPGASLSFSLN
jgi:hypothetical protein